MISESLESKGLSSDTRKASKRAWSGGGGGGGGVGGRMLLGFGRKGCHPKKGRRGKIGLGLGLELTVLFGLSGDLS